MANTLSLFHLFITLVESFHYHFIMVYMKSKLNTVVKSLIDL